jgi:AcrR family transcriptional regulator
LPIDDVNAVLESAPSALRTRRRRRTREEVTQRIEEAAKQLFAQHGFSAATTREIAQLADVSETLLFRYYGDKAKLFEAVVTAPFHRLMDEFVRGNPDPIAGEERIVAARRFTRDVFALLDGNETMFRALFAGGDDTAPSLAGLAPFFRESASQVSQRYQQMGQPAPFDPEIAVRLGFGLILSAVLFRDTLFAGASPSPDGLVEAVDQIIMQVLISPPPIDNTPHPPM